MGQLRFKRDTSFRKQFFVPNSFAHPAKMDAQLLLWIVNKYSEAGETILDPMAGSGTTMLACTLGRNVVLVELEEKFCKMMRDNWERVKTRPQLGCEMGLCDIKQGDARDLTGLFAGLIPKEKRLPQQVDKIVTSPPYVGVLATEDAEAYRKRRLKTKPNPKTGTHPFKASIESAQKVGADYGKNPTNIGNLPYGQIDKIVTSPPYEAAVSASTGGERDMSSARQREKRLRDKGYDPVKYQGGVGRNLEVDFQYTKDKDNIGNLKSQSYLEDYWDILDIIALIPYNIVSEVYKKCYQDKKSNGTGITDTTKKSKKRSESKWQLDENNESILAQIAERLAILEPKDAEPVLTRLEVVIAGQTNKKPISVKSLKRAINQESGNGASTIEGEPSLKSQEKTLHSGKADTHIGEEQATLPYEQDSLISLAEDVNSVGQRMATRKTRLEFIISYLSKKVDKTKSQTVLSSVIRAIVQLKTNSRQEASPNTNSLEQSAELKEQWIRSSPDQHNNYLAQMFLIYRQCYSVLRNGGLMVLVVKNFIRNKAVVRLDEDTIKLCEQAGFSFVERHERVLSSQSFWRITYHQRYPDVEQIKNEDILVFRAAK